MEQSAFRRSNFHTGTSLLLGGELLPTKGAMFLPLSRRFRQTHPPQTKELMRKHHRRHSVNQNKTIPCRHQLVTLAQSLVFLILKAAGTKKSLFLIYRSYLHQCRLNSKLRQSLRAIAPKQPMPTTASTVLIFASSFFFLSPWHSVTSTSCLQQQPP